MYSKCTSVKKLDLQKSNLHPFNHFPEDNLETSLPHFTPGFTSHNLIYMNNKLEKILSSHRDVYIPLVVCIKDHKLFLSFSVSRKTSLAIEENDCAEFCISVVRMLIPCPIKENIVREESMKKGIPSALRSPNCRVWGCSLIPTSRGCFRNSKSALQL